MTATSLKICLVGGIYGKDESFRANLQITPETTLEKGLRALGHSVSTYSHYERLNAAEFDIVHVHHLSWGALRMALTSSGPPLVFTGHDGNVMAGTLPIWRRYVLRFVQSTSDAVVVLSKAEAENLSREYGVNHCVVIPNGIDPAVFTYRPARLVIRKDPSKPWQLLYVGQLIELKRVDLLLAALSMLPSNIELQLVYHNTEKETELRNYAESLGLGERVHFLGGKSRQELAQLYHNADVFVLPSSVEALPSTVSEAMLSGTPIVATEVGGIKEQLAGFGLTVSPGSARALARGIADLISNYDGHRARSKMMSEHAVSTFSIEKMVSDHVALYRALITAGKIRRKLSVWRPLARLGTVGLEVLCRAK